MSVVLSLISQVRDADGAQDLQLTAGQVEFDRVSFSYVPGCVANMLLMIITGVSLWFHPVSFSPGQMQSWIIHSEGLHECHIGVWLQNVFRFFCACVCVFVCSMEVLRGVTFTVEAGQTVALVGCENRMQHMK